MTGFEPVTSSLPRKRSTPELHRRKVLNQLPLNILLKEETPAFAGMTINVVLERETGFPSTPLGINFSPYQKVNHLILLERETGFEPATFSLEG